MSLCGPQEGMDLHGGDKCIILFVHSPSLRVRERERGGGSPLDLSTSFHGWMTAQEGDEKRREEAQYWPRTLISESEGVQWGNELTGEMKLNISMSLTLISVEWVSRNDWEEIRTETLRKKEKLTNIHFILSSEKNGTGSMRKHTYFEFGRGDRQISVYSQSPFTRGRRTTRRRRSTSRRSNHGEILIWFTLFIPIRC